MRRTDFPVGFRNESFRRNLFVNSVNRIPSLLLLFLDYTYDFMLMADYSQLLIIPHLVVLCIVADLHVYMDSMVCNFWLTKTVVESYAHLIRISAVSTGGGVIRHHDRPWFLRRYNCLEI